MKVSEYKLTSKRSCWRSGAGAAAESESERGYEQVVTALLKLYTNFFQPTMKLQSKERVGSKVTKRYDRAQTPYQRVLAAPQIAKAKKDLLRAKYETLNPAGLKRKITRLQERLLKTTGSAKRVRVRPRQCSNDRYFANTTNSLTKP